MFSPNTFSSSTFYSHFHLPPRCPTFLSATFRRRSRRRNRRNKLTSPTTPHSEPKIETVIDLTHLTTFQTSLRYNIRQFVSSAEDAYTDLQTLLTLDHSRRLVVSCRPSTLNFVATSTLFTFLSFTALRLIIDLGSRFWNWSRNASSYSAPMVRRDRSLGGREVVVGTVAAKKPAANPLSPVERSLSLRRASKNKVVGVQKKLPKWWPHIINGTVLDVDDQEEYKREAYRVVRAIVDSRMAGKDIIENDIIQLRQLCRTSGVQVSIDPANVRDSLYRASVSFVLNVCSRAPTYSTSIDIDGEDAQKFLAGFAENIGLENVRAATMVSAAVAARTRSCLLQAWALEMQGKHIDATVELSKICLFLRIFPPEESSPEMEMVGRGLEKHLKLEQRKHLMFLFAKVCGEDSQTIAREALGLMHSQFSDQLEDNFA
ncbi:PREDICTED: uncharacterized protein LOC109335869 [Lupinus angustifolius]|uniref:uncharacterized protein LOC109335869 n=1 Tax=Lupinus angustifolius TaxID=3871 RepID=UPI00092E4C2B|nr:PREDICTED: uncharacterized protein LOC109335869 [Lupinus angustifolius]